MGLTLVLRVGKKGAIYLPKAVMEMLGVREGDKVIARVEDSKLVLEFIPDPFSLALRVEKWAKTTVEELERESEELQDEILS